MAIRHIGYAVQDGEGDIFVGSISSIDDYAKTEEEAKDLLDEISGEFPEYAPHKIVRLLIDDEKGE